MKRYDIVLTQNNGLWQASFKSLSGDASTNHIETFQDLMTKLTEQEKRLRDLEDQEEIEDELQRD